MILPTLRARLFICHRRRINFSIFGGVLPLLPEYGVARNIFTFTFYRAVLQGCPQFAVFWVAVLKSYE